MTSKNEPKYYKDSQLADPTVTICNALSQEITASRADPSRAIEVVEGGRIYSEEYGHLYTFKAEVATPIPPETPIQLIIDDIGMIKGILSISNFILKPSYIKMTGGDEEGNNSRNGSQIN